jgi:prevent-host-death family protein
MSNNVTATEAHRHLGKVLQDAQSDPVFISKGGKITAVVLSFDALQRLVSRNVDGRGRPEVEKLLRDSIKQWGAVYKALGRLG